ncbi:MAG: hypothetical protein MI741_22815, partial [Rhodospirillales bacterium]|nr:hypothetical protein [Rhodospirillales bacterium]
MDTNNTKACNFLRRVWMIGYTRTLVGILAVVAVVLSTSHAQAASLVSALQSIASNNGLANVDAFLNFNDGSAGVVIDNDNDGSVSEGDFLIGTFVITEIDVFSTSGNTATEQTSDFGLSVFGRYALEVTDDLADVDLGSQTAADDFEFDSVIDTVSYGALLTSTAAS